MRVDEILQQSTVILYVSDFLRFLLTKTCALNFSFIHVPPFIVLGRKAVKALRVQHFHTAVSMNLNLRQQDV